MKKLFLLSIIPFFSACEDGLVLDASTVKSIEYQFRDSSVPPQYHRSYSIVVQPKTVRIKVDSYGDILADKTIDIRETSFVELITTINASRLVSVESRSEAGCSGGTSEILTIFTTDGQVYQGDFEHCGGIGIPEKAGDVKNVVQALKNLIPDFATYLE